MSSVFRSPCATGRTLLFLREICLWLLTLRWSTVCHMIQAPLLFPRSSPCCHFWPDHTLPLTWHFSYETLNFAFLSFSQDIKSLQAVTMLVSSLHPLQGLRYLMSSHLMFCGTSFIIAKHWFVSFTNLSKGPVHLYKVAPLRQGGAFVAYGYFPLT